MGQYYHIIIKTPDNKIHYNDRTVKGEGYIMAKLMEHSYKETYLMKSVANVLSNGKCRLIWCGDYAEPKEIRMVSKHKASYKRAWVNDKSQETYDTTILTNKKFDFHHKFFVNHTKKIYVTFDDYKKDKYGWSICPISLLTAIGNGRGGGDYHGLNDDKVGSWAWDEVSVCNKRSDFPKDYKLVKIQFKEEY